MKNGLSSSEKLRLRQLHRQERDGRTRDRIKAVLAYDEGYTYTEIARILLIDDETVRRHIQDYCNENKLSIESGGSDSKLNEKQTQALTAHLSDHTYLYVKDICQHVKEKYQVQYTNSGMTKWLHANEFSYKKPHGVPAKADTEAQDKFITFYNRLTKRVGSKEPIYFADSVHPQHQTRLAYGWIRTGERKEIPTTGRQKRVNIIGGICLNGHKVVTTQADTVNADSIAGFFCELRKKHPEKHRIHVILDRAPYHRDGDLQKFAKNLGIKLHYLPPYSPNLNPVERLWKIMHEHVTYNKYYETFQDFTDAVLVFFKNIGRKKCLLRTRINDNFQTLNLTQFAY